MIPLRLLSWLTAALFAFPAAVLAAPVELLVAPECATDLSRLRTQFPQVDPGRYYLIVRHHGDPETPEWLGQVANPVTWDVSRYTGFRPPEPLPEWQRGYYDLGGEVGSSAVQWHCSDVGFLLNTYQFSHTVPVRGGGPNIAYEIELSPRPQVWSTPERGLRIEVDLRLPWVYAVQPGHDVGRGIGQVSLFYYAEQRSTGRLFAHVIALFDTRPFGLGNGGEMLSHDTFVDFASSPVVAQLANGDAPRYIEVVAGSARLRNENGWTAPLHFGIEVDGAGLQRILDDLALRGGAESDADDWGLRSVGVLVEAFPGDANDYNVSIGGSASNLTISMIDRSSVFGDSFEARLTPPQASPAASR